MEDVLIEEECPFCEGNGSLTSKYHSDINSPDGARFFVECDDCGSQGKKFYAVTTGEYNLNKKQIREQNKLIQEAKNKAIEAWNRRSCDN